MAALGLHVEKGRGDEDGARVPGCVSGHWGGGFAARGGGPKKAFTCGQLYHPISPRLRGRTAAVDGLLSINPLPSSDSDGSGRVPTRTRFFRLIDGEGIGNLRIPLAVTDRLTAEADRAGIMRAGHQERPPASASGESEPAVDGGMLREPADAIHRRRH